MSLESWKTFFETGGVILLFLTFLFGAGVVLTSKKINVLQAEEARQFGIKLAEQRERAANAEHDAAEAKATAASVDGRTLILQADAANAKAAQEKVEIDLEKQKELTITAERKLLELKSSLKDRTISPSQRQDLIKALANGPKGPVQITWIASDTDSYPLAIQIKEVLDAAGWPNVSEQMAIGGTGDGLFIVVNSLQSAPQRAGFLQKSFASVGITLTGSENPNMARTDEVHIFIGHKQIAH